MSGSHSSGEGKTNIERKVLRNTLISNSNYLKYKDESTSRPSVLSMSSKLLNSITNSHNILSMDLSNLNSDVFSISQSMQNFLFKPDLDPSHLDDQLFIDMFLNSLHDVLNRSEPGATVILPDKHIILGNLYLSVPIILKGAPGTILEIRGGTITVDLDEYAPQHYEENNKLVLCEMSIIYNCSGNTPEVKHPALFTLNAKNTLLEVRDCDIKSVSNDLQNVTTEFRDISDICFMLNATQKKSYKQTSYSSKLIIKSCNISNFFEVIRSGIHSSLAIEKAHFTQTTGSCINIKSPREFSLTSSVIEKVAKYGIVIKLTDDAHKLERGSYSTIDQVKIDGNDIRSIGSSGVLISSENKAQIQYRFIISNNKITNCKQDAITMKQLNLHELEISRNDLSCNTGTSIWLQKVIMAQAGRNILLSYNRCFDSHAGYGIYLYDTCAELENNECFRNNLGGLMIVGSPVKENTGRLCDLLIKNCTMHTNGENGITILDYLIGSVNISSCKIHENYHNGVYLLKSRENTAVKRTSDKVLPIVGDLLIENSEIFLNKQYGITLSKILCTISNTIISDNQEGAISLDEESKKLLKFRDEDEVRLRQFIHGSIGGDWGKMYPGKKKGCGNNECMLL